MGQIAEDVAMHTLFNSRDESITISETELLDNLAALGIFDINETNRTVKFSQISGRISDGRSGYLMRWMGLRGIGRVRQRGWSMGRQGGIWRRIVFIINFKIDN